MATKLEHALDLAEQGFYVFRLRKNSKLPLAKGWQQEATRDPEEIRQLFRDRDFNIGIFTGRHESGALMVVDVDTKQGKEGEKTMRGLEAMALDMPPTLTATTASGGRHHVYWNEFEVPGGANKVGLHVDLKSYGGYIVGAGSTIDGTPYLWANNEPIAHAPNWLVTKAGRASDKTPLTAIIANLDDEQAIDRSIAYLRDMAPEAIAYSGGNNTTLKVALECHDFGCSEAMTTELLWEHYNPVKCQPGWEYDELATIVKNAYKSAFNPIGVNSPNKPGVFEPIPDEEVNGGRSDPLSPPTGKRQLTEEMLEWTNKIGATLNREPLIDNMLDQGTMSIMYGESNSGKTFVALELAYRVATGEPLGERETSKGSVIYVAAEGGITAKNRIQALKQHYNNDDFDLALLAYPINLLDSEADMAGFAKTLKRAEEERGDVKLIIIDTLSRALAGGNENDSQDMGAFVKNLDIIRNKTKAHLMVVHHSGKDTSKGARGHSLLRAATDTELEIVEKTITTRKQRDMEFSPPQGFELLIVELGTTTKGKPVTSCVVNLTTLDPNAINEANRLNPRDLIALLALKEWKSDRAVKGYDNVIDLKTWQQCCKDFDYTLVPGSVPWPQSEEAARKAFQRARDRLIGFGKVVEVADKQYAMEKTGQ